MDSFENLKKLLANNQSLIADKIAMANPEMQGPRQPGVFEEPLPVEKQMATNALQSVASGSLGSGPTKAQAIADAEANLAARVPQLYTKEKADALKQLAEQIKNREGISTIDKAKVFQKLDDYLRKARIRGVNVD